MATGVTVGSWVWLSGPSRWALIVSILNPTNWNYVLPDPGATVTNSTQDLNTMSDEFFTEAGDEPQGNPSGGG